MATPVQHTINTPYMVGPVHCYSAVLSGELVLFDTGPATPATSNFLRKNIDLNNLRHVLVTHCHIDHYGQAWWLEKEFGVTIYVPYRDYRKLKEHDLQMVQMHHLMVELGFSDEYLLELRRVFESGALFPPFPKNFRVAERDLPEKLGVEVLPCPGHSQSDVVYTFGDFAITGDTMLKTIFQSPLLEVDCETGKRFENYRAYCSSVVNLAQLEGKTILPGHRYNLESIKETLLFYIEKLLERVKQLQVFQDEEDLMVLLDKVMAGKELDVFHIYLKASEILFMKDFLAEPQLLRKALEEVGLFESVAGLYGQIV